MAAVFVVATLPPFSRPGYKVDITVSSAGDARSLEGGILLMTPLYGPDGQIYAQAQGSLVLGGYMATGGGNTNRSTTPPRRGFPAARWWSGRCPSTSSRCISVNVVLNDADFHTAERMAAAINQALGRPRACRRQPPRGDRRRLRTKTWRLCWTAWRPSRSRSIRGPAWWSTSAREQW